MQLKLKRIRTDAYAKLGNWTESQDLKKNGAQLVHFASLSYFGQNTLFKLGIMFIKMDFSLFQNQCCGSMTFWGGSGSGSADPCLWIMDPDSDPDPAIFVIDLQDPIFGHQNPWIRICFGSGSVFSLKCWIQIRIRIKWIRIRNPDYNHIILVLFHYLYKKMNTALFINVIWDGFSLYTPLPFFLVVSFLTLIKDNNVSFEYIRTYMSYSM
jgi:hypothetical protein